MVNAKPFLKWAGGKRQLINNLVARLPAFVTSSKEIDTYIEPFIGGGSFFFHLQNNYKIKTTIIMDINADLILAYKTIQSHVSELITELNILQETYLKKNIEEQQLFFYEIRTQYNSSQKTIDYDHFSFAWIERSKLLIFLNRTCFNGLFRQNRKGEFNVPFGKYANPKICDAENLEEVSKSLQNTEIICGDFQQSETFVKKNTLIYLDPPYRPLKQSSSFTSYSKEGFNDDDQRRLADYYTRMDKIGASLILSNSDPQNTDKDDNFFEALYKKFLIRKVSAKRNINSKADGRGTVLELMITNYQID